MVCTFILDFIYTKTYSNCIPRTKFQYLRLQKNKSFDYIFLGSSRVENSVVSNLIEEKTGKTSINLAMQGSNLSDIHFIQKLLKSYNINYKKIFIQLDGAFYTPNDFSIIVNYESAPFINENIEISNFFKLSNAQQFWECKNIPFYKYIYFSSKLGFREFAASLFSIEKHQFSKGKGYFPLKNSFKKTKLDFDQPINKNCFLDSIVNFNKSNKFNCVFYTSPFRINSKNELNKLNQLVSKLPMSHNFSTILQNDNYFQDNYHLNHKGALIFTSILIEKLKL
jgi:hypothetical protein